MADPKSKLPIQKERAKVVKPVIDLIDGELEAIDIDPLSADDGQALALAVDDRELVGDDRELIDGSQALALPAEEGDELALAVDVIDVPGSDDEPLAEEVVPALRKVLKRKAGAQSIVRHDPLAAYMAEIRRYPLLSREEEHELADRYVKTGDLAVARRLVTANLRLVVKIAHEYRRSYKNILDLVQEGNVGLLHAVKKYDPYRGVKLSSYAAWWIRAYILKYLLTNWRMVKIGTTQAQRKLFFNLRKEREFLEKSGFEVGPRLLAERLQVSEEDVNEMQQRLAAPDLSLDAPVGSDEDSDRTPLDKMSSSSANRPDKLVESEEFRALLREKLERFAETLKGRDTWIFRERLLTDTPLTLQEIGEKYGITRERARQLEKRITTNLRAYLEQELGEVVNIGASDEREE